MLKKKCKHKHHEERNHEIGGYNIPDGCLTHYDIYCANCGIYLGSWDFGYSNVEENLYFDKWYHRLTHMVKNKIWSFKNRKILNEMSDDPFADFDSEVNKHE